MEAGLAGESSKMVWKMETEHHKNQLLALKKSLLRAQESGDAAEQTVELDQSRVGRLSRMDALQAQAMSKETDRPTTLIPS